MPTEDEMTVNERRKYLKRMKPLYLKAKTVERSRLLTGMEQVTGMHRKSLSRLLHDKSLEHQKRQKPRQRSYGAEVEEVILHVPTKCATSLTVLKRGADEYSAHHRNPNDPEESILLLRHSCQRDQEPKERKEDEPRDPDCPQDADCAVWTGRGGEKYLCAAVFRADASGVVRPLSSADLRRGSHAERRSRPL